MWGPAGRSASVSITFDHLGEAAELELGGWPKSAPIGHHHSVEKELPELLALLDLVGVRATFFVEAWNASVYPDALATIADRGHEIGCHSFRHENWEQLSVPGVEAILDRSLAAYAECGLSVVGVRPPGGLPPEGYAEVLRTRGLQYVSLAEDGTGVDAGLAHLPFQWQTVDGLYYHAFLAHMRQPPGEGSVDTSTMLAAFDGIVDEVVSVGGHVSFDFHVPMQDSAERLSGLEEWSRRLAADDRVWLAPCADIASWMLDRADEFPYAGAAPARRVWDRETVEAARVARPSGHAR